MKSKYKKGSTNKTSQSGFTIYLVFIVLLIAAIIVFVSLYSINSVRKQAAIELKKFQAKTLAESGLVRAEYFLNGGDGHQLDWETENYSEDLNTFGKITLKNSRFGVFTKIESKGNRLDYSCTIKGLFGRDIPEILEPTITLTGHIGGLELKDNSKITGTVVLFHGGIKQHSQSQVIIRESPSLPFDTMALPLMSKDCNEQFVKMLSGKNAISGNKIFFDNKDTAMVKDTIIVYGDCDFIGVDINNKCVAISGKLTINKNTRIEQSSFFCEKCIIDQSTTNNSFFFSKRKMIIENGIHNSQFIANDTIEIEKKAQFGNMALFVNYREMQNDTLVSGGVFLKEQSRFTGIMISGIDSIAKKRVCQPSIVLGKQTNINGIIITDHNIYMRENIINGHIWARQIESSDEKMSYTNYLFQCIISASQGHFLFPLFGPTPVSIRLIGNQIQYGLIRFTASKCN